MKTRLLTLLVFVGLLVPASAAKGLQIYFIDVEGGQATLLVAPDGQSLLIDTGFPGEGTFESHPGDPQKARDAIRIVSAAKDAGVEKIDYVLITHAHADHIGGVTELSQLMPIGTFIDNGGPLPEAEKVAGTLQAFKWYEAVAAKGHRLQPKPGDRLPLKGVDAAVIVSGAGETISMPLPGGGETNAACGATAQPPQEPTENPRSLGVRIDYGKFSFFDPGDLTGTPLFALACPKDMIGAVDVYLVAHHGGADAADPATFAAWRPRVAIANNGPLKGGTPNLLDVLRNTAGVDGWQLHHSLLNGAQDVPADRVANLDDSASYWIKVTANADGSFVVTNGRTGQSKAYPHR